MHTVASQSLSRARARTATRSDENAPLFPFAQKRWRGRAAKRAVPSRQRRPPRYPPCRGDVGRSDPYLQQPWWWPSPSATGRRGTPSRPQSTAQRRAGGCPASPEAESGRRPHCAGRHPPAPPSFRQNSGRPGRRPPPPSRPSPSTTRREVRAEAAAADTAAAAAAIAAATRRGGPPPARRRGPAHGSARGGGGRWQRPPPPGPPQTRAAAGTQGPDRPADAVAGGAAPRARRPAHHPLTAPPGEGRGGGCLPRSSPANAPPEEGGGGRSGLTSRGTERASRFRGEEGGERQGVDAAAAAGGGIRRRPRTAPPPAAPAHPSLPPRWRLAAAGSRSLPFPPTPSQRTCSMPP